jgi:hypothetical protein
VEQPLIEESAVHTVMTLKQPKPLAAHLLQRAAKGLGCQWTDGSDRPARVIVLRVRCATRRAAGSLRPAAALRNLLRTARRSCRVAEFGRGDLRP